MLGFDFSLHRIGVAVGTLELGLARPLTTIEARSDAPRLAAVAELLGEWAPVLLVVGLPLTLEGEEQPASQRCRRFARQLQARFGIPVQLVDERLTSHAAGLALDEAGVRGRRRKDLLDQVAAQHILQAFFETRHDHSPA